MLDTTAAPASLPCTPATPSLAQEQAYWTSHVSASDAYVFYDDAEYNLILELLDRKYLQGKLILEIGCGPGVWTANFARLQARVVHFDLTPFIVQVAHQTAAPHVTYGLAADMHHLPFQSDMFDLVFGSMVLHHAQDHQQLGAEVARVLKPGGRAIFHENSARNPLLMLARAKLVGRWGIPKNSSPNEHPLQVDEIAAFGQAFCAHQTYFGRMVFLQLAVKYLLKRETGPAFTLARHIDNWLYQRYPSLHHWSYYQIVACSK